MSSKTKTSRKAKNPRPKAPEPIITRTKSRQLRNREEKQTEKPELTKPEIKSPKVTKTVKRPQVSLLKVPVTESDVAVIEQVEYYPNTLKRDVTTKKIMLKPKHNFKVIAATNKRKLATPQKGIKSPPSKHSSTRNGYKSLKRSKIITTRPCSSPELSMQDMVRMMEETRSLSDEDFMEILTCPSPVWWEDPPDVDPLEDSVDTRPPEPPEKITKESKKRKVTENKKSSKSNNINTIEQDTEQPKEIENKKDERFVKKKQKLENILGNIKNKTIQTKNVVKNDNNKNRKPSESEGDFSDMSFNEEEILKNLENMDIPIEQSLTESVDNKSEIEYINIKEELIDIHENEMVAPKNDNADREILTIEIKQEIKEEFSIKSPVFDKDLPITSSEFKSDVSLEEIHSNSDKKSDVIVDNCTNFSPSNNDDSSSILGLDNSSNSVLGKNETSKESSVNVDVANNSNTVNLNDIVPNKKTKDLSEFITVYKITPEDFKTENNPDNEVKPAENTKRTKLDTVRGKLNDFFKQCKSNMRMKKTDNKPIPAIPVTDVKETIENEKENGDTKIDLEDDKNRLKNCDYCIEKTENGETDFSCEKCEMAPILPCGLCNFLADSKEVYRKHVSYCKDVARISWSHNYVLNQT